MNAQYKFKNSFYHIHIISWRKYSIVTLVDELGKAMIPTVEAEADKLYTVHEEHADQLAHRDRTHSFWRPICSLSISAKGQV